MSSELEELFANNRRRVAETGRREPGFFSRLLEPQTPHCRWIGGADSRVTRMPR